MSLVQRISQSRYMNAALLALAGYFCIAVMNAGIKKLHLLGYSVYQIAFSNSLIAIICLGLFFVLRQDSQIKKRPPLLLTAYLAAALGACFTLFTAFGSGPLHLISAIVAASPLVVAILSRFVLHENLTRKEIFFIICGFLGVMIVIKPNGDTQTLLPIYCAIAGTILFALSQVMVKKMSGQLKPLTFTAYFYASLLLVTFFIADFKSFQTQDLPYFVIAGGADVLSLVLIYSAFARAPASFVAPFEFSFVVWSSLLGLIIWREVPDQISLLGAAVIIASGIFFLGARKAQAA